MSILIKNMKKPFECLQCPFWTMYIAPQKPLDVCLASDKKPIDCADLRPEWCPIVYMPENHGRLIDADKLHQSIKESIEECRKWCEEIPQDNEMYHRVSQALGTFVECALRVKNAETVVEAEEIDNE